MARKKLTKIKTLKRNLDNIFSKYIRMRDTEDGYGACISCKKVFPYEKLDCGHFIGRAKLKTRWDERNCNGQCQNCNRFRDGEQALYLVALEEKYGREVVDELMAARYQTFKVNRQFYVEMIEKYKSLINEL